MSITDSYFSEILSPYAKPQTLDVLSKEGDLGTYKVLLNKSQKFEELENDKNTPYLLISKQCFDHANTFLFIQNFYQQYHFAHPAIMPLLHLSISPNNSFEAYYKYPDNGRLSDYIGFSHELPSNSKELTQTQKSIISYGLAHALRYIHQHGYQFGEVNAKNVYLDNEFHPYLTNFYSIKKINDQRVPESKRLTDMHLKLDVLTYSIIYAALIEPVAFDPPVKSAKEFFQRFNSKRRPVCKNATEEQRDVLDKMWDWVPRDRLTFDEIINCFESEELIFPDTDMNEFTEYKKYLDEFQDKPQVPLSPPQSPSSPHDQPSPARVKRVAELIVNTNENHNDEISTLNDEYNQNGNSNAYRTRTIQIPISHHEEENNEKDINLHEEEQNENDEDKSSEIKEEKEEVNIVHEEESNEEATNKIEEEEEEIESITNTGENVNDSEDWQPREIDLNQEKVFDDDQPIEKDNYQDDHLDNHSEDENENDQNDHLDNHSENENENENDQNDHLDNHSENENENDQNDNVQDDQSNEQPLLVENHQTKETNATSDLEKEKKEEDLEKKLNIHVRRHDDRGFKESDDSSSSNHSDQFDEADDALSQTQSVESDIQYIGIDNDNDDVQLEDE